MKVLAPVSTPPSSPVSRSHSPFVGTHHKQYRRCLRWDFGFTCPLCLTHDTDLFLHGVDGTGLTSAEHVETQSSAPSKKTDYANLIYACRLCNGSRASRPITDSKTGASLLDPTKVPWSGHFARSGDHLTPAADDDDATRTHKIYNLDHPLKVEMRRARREQLEEAARILRETEPTVRELHALVAAGTLAPRDEASVLRAAQDLATNLVRAASDIRRFAAIPVDAPSSCRCDDPRLELAAAVLHNTWEFSGQ